jgi:hypothetical protein
LQDRVGDRDLSDVVQQRDLFDIGDLSVVEREMSRDCPGLLDHRLGVLAGVGIPCLD